MIHSQLYCHVHVVRTLFHSEVKNPLFLGGIHVFHSHEAGDFRGLIRMKYRDFSRHNREQMCVEPPPYTVIVEEPFLKLGWRQAITRDPLRVIAREKRTEVRYHSPLDSE